MNSDLRVLHQAPGVKQWNNILWKIKELLDCKCTEALKLTAADIKQDFLTMR